MLKGTFRYLCPDLFTGTTYSAGTDLWALGVSLFESAMGRKAASGGQQMVLAAIIGGRIMQLHQDETLHPLLQRTFHALLRTDDAARRITDASVLEKVFAGLSDKLGDGAAVARAVMQEQRQGDVSGEFGADDLVPTIVDEGGLSSLMGLTGPSSSDVFASASSSSSSSSSMSSAHGPGLAMGTQTAPSADPRHGIDDNQGPTMLLPAQHHPPLPPGVSAPRSLPTLAIDIVVMEDVDMSDMFDMSDVDGIAITTSGEGAPTLAMPAVGPPGALSSSQAPPTVAMPISALPTMALPSFAAPPTIALHRAMWHQPSSSAEAPPTVMLAQAPAPVARPTLELPIFVDDPDDDDPPRE
jgi:hypothetical protein